MTGLIAQQQCVGPLHTPVADVAVTSLSYISTLGAATAIGEQPIKMLVDPSSGARMCLGEALTNLMFAQITELKVGLIFEISEQPTVIRYFNLSQFSLMIRNVTFLFFVLND